MLGKVAAFGLGSMLVVGLASARSTEVMAPPVDADTQAAATVEESPTEAPATYGVRLNWDF